MATAAKFVQPIAIFLAYLIQLDVDAAAILKKSTSKCTTSHGI